MGNDISHSLATISLLLVLSICCHRFFFFLLRHQPSASRSQTSPFLFIHRNRPRVRSLFVPLITSISRFTLLTRNETAPASVVHLGCEMFLICHIMIFNSIGLFTQINKTRNAAGIICHTRIHLDGIYCPPISSCRTSSSPSSSRSRSILHSGYFSPISVRNVI